MSTFLERLLALVAKTPGSTDRELANDLLGKDKHPSQVNQGARLLAQRGRIIRKHREDGLIGNFPGDHAGKAPLVTFTPVIARTPERLSEDEIKEVLEKWLCAHGWSVTVMWGNARGVDIQASHEGKRWLIEVKGLGSLQPMRVNYFIAILGEILQRMNDAKARYSIALPDVAQFRGLWQRLPALAKQRTGISALFVGTDGEVREEG